MLCEGYATDLFLDDVGAFECEICNCVVRDGVEHGVCLQLFCEGCIKRMFAISKPQQQHHTCPHCSMTVQRSDFRPMNRILRDLLSSKRLHCPCRPCEAVLAFGAIMKHLGTCEFEECECEFEGCGVRVLRREMPEHTQACVHRTAKCAHCAGIVKYTSLEEHYGVCRRIPVPCPQCAMMIAKEEVPVHLQHSCAVQPFMCNVGGCITTVNRDQHTHHVTSFAADHVIAMSEQLSKLKTDMEEMRRELNTLRQDIVTKDAMISSLQSRLPPPPSTPKFPVPPPPQSAPFGTFSGRPGLSGPFGSRSESSAQSFSLFSRPPMPAESSGAGSPRAEYSFRFPTAPLAQPIAPMFAFGSTPMSSPTVSPDGPQVLSGDGANAARSVNFFK